MERPVLFISPHSEDAETLSRMLAPVDVPLRHAGDLRQARSNLERDEFGVVLTEAALPDGSWTDVLDLTRELHPSSEVIVTRPFADSRFWAEALSMGAYDLLVQPFYPSEVQRILSNACARSVREHTAGAAW
jgi:DNA-binding NtrC family response regulator